MEDTSFNFQYHDESIYFELKTAIDVNKNIQKILVHVNGSCTSEEIILKKLTLIGDNKQTLIDFVDEAKRDYENPNVPPPKNFNFKNPLNRWRSHRNTFFSQWVSYCYLKISTQDMLVKENLSPSINSS